MSARPLPGPMRVDDLDLLISRSLDGDLAVDEERDLQRLITTDPAARRRYDAMAGVVSQLEALPDPEPSFALSVRVVATVEERSKGLVSAFHRLGFFPGPVTVALGGVFVLALAFGITFLMPSSELRLPAKGVAAKAPVSDGPVEVFFSDSPSKKVAEARPQAVPPAAVVAAAPTAAAQPAAPRPAEPVQIASAESLRRDAGRFAPEVDGLAGAKQEKAKKDLSRAERESGPVASGAGANAVGERTVTASRFAEEQALAPARPAEEKVAVLGDETRGVQERNVLAKERPVSSGALAAPAPPAAAVGATSELDAARPRAVASRAAAAKPAAGGDTAAQGSLEITQQPGGIRISSRPSLSGLAGPFDGVYRLRLDAAGRVTGVSRVAPSGVAAPPGLEERLRTLVFEVPAALPGPLEVDLRVAIP